MIGGVDFNLYEHIPSNFFNFLTGNNKEINSRIVFRIFVKAKNNNTYTLRKDDMLDIIEDYFDEFLFNEEFYDNGELLLNSRDKATAIYRRLKECGWIDDDYDIDQTVVANFEDYTISILNNLLELNKTNNFELSGRVYNIYISLKNMEIEKAYLVLNTIYENSKELIDKLRSLNSNIKKYIKRIVTLENSNNNEYLKNLLNDLMHNYKGNVIDKAYYYLKTFDSPERYKKDFKEVLNNIENNVENKTKIINQIKDTDNISYTEADLKFDEIISYLYNIFDECIRIMHEIDKKNETYIATITRKIMIILNDNKDIEGLLLNILKNYDDNGIEIELNDRRTINSESLYNNKTRKNQVTNSLIIDDAKKINPNIVKKFIKEKTKYSRKKVYKYIEAKLDVGNIITIKDFNLENQEDLIKMLLSIVYSNDIDCPYSIQFYNDIVRKNGYKMDKFEIRRK